MLTCFSVCTGGGGLDMAAEMAGFDIVAQCEIDPYCNMLLELRYPGMPYWEDLRHVTARKFSKKTGIAPGELTLLTAGIPCQPHSLAGPRKGSADERDLKDILVEKVRGIRPRWILVENVRGILSSDDGRYFGDLLRQMAELGYDAVWCSYKASQVGAKHGRERVWIAFWRRDVGNACRRGRCGKSRGGAGTEPAVGHPGAVANPESRGVRNDCADDRETVGEINPSIGTGSCGGELGYTQGIRREPRRAEPERFERKAGTIVGSRNVADTECNGLEEQGNYAVPGGPPDSITDRGRRTTQPGLGGVPDGLADWLDSVGWIADKGEAQRGIAYPWEPPRTARGVKDRARRIKVVGNGIVPQQGFIVMEAIVEIERGLRAELPEYCAGDIRYEMR